MEFLSEYMMPIVVGLCLCVGYIIKKWVKDVDNKFIPTICAALGAFLTIWLNSWSITPEILLSGIFSGLASTGLHQAFTQYIDKNSDITQ